MSTSPVRSVVIMAAGSASRWGGYTGVPKQLAVVDGEAILHRTLRQARERCDVIVCVTVPQIDYFGELWGAVQLLGANDCEMDKFVNACSVLPALYLWGDAYYTDAAMDAIFADTDIPMFFGRAYGNDIKEYGELFAAKLDEDAIQIARDLRAVHATMPRCASWELYRAVCGYPLTEHFVEARFIEIDDATDDFDYPHDYENWLSVHRSE